MSADSSIAGGPVAAPKLRRLAIPVALATVLFGACKLEGRRPKLQFALNDKLTVVDEETGEAPFSRQVQQHIYGALAMLFGQPGAPRYLLLDDWVDDGWNPNAPRYEDGDDGSGEVTDELDVIFAENERVFARQLELIAEGRYDEVRVPGDMLDTADDWQRYVLEPMAEEDWEDGADFKEEASLTFAEWYPSLRESAELYRLQCSHCHGTSGGGDGPTADYLNPRPRDYRQGQFKFTALKDKARPRRADLYRIIEQGATGTAMPSFLRLTRAQIHGLVDYVRLLSIRGETELYLATLVEEEDGLLALSMIQDAYETTWGRWRSAEEKLVIFDGEIPAPTPELIERGRQVYNDEATGNCASCHGVDGRGNGASALVYDEETGELLRDPETREPLSAYEDDWGHPILPRNLTRGVFRGGRRPIDIYRRIYSGINGTPMPGIGDVTEGEDPPITKEDLWGLVHYVRTLSEVTHADEHGGEHSEGSH